MPTKRSRRASDYQPTIWAAGAVVYKKEDDRPRFLLVHRPRYNDWSLPKGKLDRGESFKECAEREVAEESGITGVVERPIGTVGYVTGAGNNKAVRYWLIRAKDQAFTPNSEVDRIRWFGAKKAINKTSYTRDAALIEAAIGMVGQRREGKVYLVRHVHAGDKRKWKKSDAVRPISVKGHEQAEEIVTRLVRAPINRIISSPYLRCEQTMGPVASRLGLAVTTSKHLRRDADPAGLIDLIQRNNGLRTVMCSHGETIGPLIESLAADPDVDFKGSTEWPKGSMWVLTTRRGRVVRARFIPPA